ncbi:MAG: lysophospholipid acyltransferase family protein [Verrucomicrobiaceae bacterium]|nr:lysophospholipid acyltransferase family protein [Verrucomicrobiaceae bacterium]
MRSSRSLGEILRPGCGCTNTGATSHARRGGSIPSTRIRHRAEWLLVKTATAVLPLLPRRIAHYIGERIGAVAAFVHRDGRRAAFSNLQCAFGEELTPTHRKELVLESYRYFGRASADLYWSPRVTRENVSELFDLREVDKLKRVHGDRGLIFACLHYGGFEWIGLALGLTGFDATMVTQAFKNPLLTPEINRLRRISGHQTLRREGALLRLYKALRAGRSVILAVDLTISPRLPSVPITCFGLQTCVTFAHAWLHKRTGAPIIPTHCEPLPDGRYALVLHPALEIPPDATHRQIAQACWDRFEPVIRRNPGPWLWMYKHWRYLPPNAARPYPPYANESPHFTKLLARLAREEKRGPARTVSAVTG